MIYQFFTASSLKHATNHCLCCLYLLSEAPKPKKSRPNRGKKSNAKSPRKKALVEDAAGEAKYNPIVLDDVDAVSPFGTNVVFVVFVLVFL